MKQQPSYSYEDLIRCAKGDLFGLGNAQLPLPNMLMVTRITHISETGGIYNSGEVKAELDIRPDLWFFQCHFHKDPVMPGCLGLDALWQLLGFYLAWLGNKGRGRALGCGQVKFYGQILPETKTVTYHLSLKKAIQRRRVLGIAGGEVYADEKKVYIAEDIRVGLFNEL